MTLAVLAPVALLIPGAGGARNAHWLRIHCLVRIDIGRQGLRAWYAAFDLVCDPLT